MSPDALPFIIFVISAFTVFGLAIAFAEFATGPAMRKGAHARRAERHAEIRKPALGRG